MRTHYCYGNRAGQTRRDFDNVQQPKAERRTVQNDKLNRRKKDSRKLKAARVTLQIFSNERPQQIYSAAGAFYIAVGGRKAQPNTEGRPRKKA